MPDPTSLQPEPTTLQVETSSVNGHFVIVLRGDVDMSTAPLFDAVATQGMSEGAHTVEIDATDLGFIDSTGLSVIAVLIRRLRPSGNRLAIRNCPALLVKLLEITALREHVNVIDS